MGAFDWFLGAAEKLTKFIPGAGPIISEGIGAFKDLQAGGKIDLSGLSSDIGDLKGNLDKANAKIDAQGKALQGQINGVKSELEGQLKRQGEKFDQEIKVQDAKIAQLSGEQKKQAEEQKKALQKQKEELQREIQETTEKLTRAQNLLKQEVDDLRNEVNERFEQQEKKILDNKRKIEEERIQREEEIRETYSKIKLTNTNLENLRKEKDELTDDIQNYKATIDRKTAETQQEFEDLEADYNRKTRIIETKLAYNEELLEEFQDNLTNIRNEQAQQKLYQQELSEELQEQSDILHFQKHKLEFVANQMEEISEEVHERMNKVQQDHNKLFTLATETSQQVNNLTEEVKNISHKTVELEKQLEKNKQDIHDVKEEAKLTNERLDNLLKTQSLKDYSAEFAKLDKITKSLELKAEETKLLATFKLLQQTKKLIPPQVSEREWKVGIKEGTEKKLDRAEGMPLNPNSSWAKQYSSEQLREWGWDTRLHGDNESAPLTTEDKRKEEQIQPNQPEKSQNSSEKNEENELVFEKIEELKAQLLEQLQEVQQNINKNLSNLEEKSEEFINTPKNNTAVNSNYSPSRQELEQAFQEHEESISQDKQEELVQEWENIQTLSEQVLQEPAPLAESQEMDVEKKLEELTQQIKEMEQTAAASQKQMTKWMLFVIIFLLEYVVYKKNGVLGLVILNVILAIIYYKKDTILQYRELWEKYFLIIGYVMGNALAYSAPTQEKYKWPSVIAFNAIILGIYGYTYYQKKQEEARIEAFYQENTKSFLQEMNFTEEDQRKIQEGLNSMSGEQLNEILGWKNPFGSDIPTSQKAEQFNQVITKKLTEQEIIKQKELEIQQQTENLQKATEIENNLKEIHNNLGENKMSWSRIKERYPDFVNRSILLKELASADKILAKPEEKEPNQKFLTKLAKIPAISSQENNLLSQLHLTIEQFMVISCQSQSLNSEDKDWLTDNYPSLTIQQQLSLLNAGLNALGIDTIYKKRIFVNLNHQLYQESNNFGLNVKEKENILRLLVNTLNLSQEQQNYLENMGISFFNASEWQVDNTQKNQLLRFGLSKVNLNEKQKDNLSNLASDRFKTFSLTEEQKNVLQNLAPLTRADKYSLASLELLNSLQLKPNSLSFFINEEILPNPHLDFGEATSPYLPLKLKFLLGEQKILEKQTELTEKEQKKQEIEQRKFSIIHSLLEFAENNQELAKFDYLLEDWVKIDALTTWQGDILLTLGLKTIPEYNFFELLTFSVENILNKNLGEFLNNYPELQANYQQYLETQKNKPVIINKFNWDKYAGHNQQQQEIINNLNLEELINNQIQQVLNNYQPQEEEIFTDTEEEITAETPQSTPQSSRYDDLLNNLTAEEQARQRKKLERQEAQNKLVEAERLRREAKLSEKDRKLKEDAEKREQEKLLQEQEDQKRREAEEQRTKILQEEQERFLQQKLSNIEEARRRAEENLANQKKQNELDEQRKRDEITKLEKENQAEQERLTNQAQLIEEEAQKKLASIALEDKEARQIIEKQTNEEKARIESEMNEKKRKNDEELKKKENALLKEKQEKQIELDKLQKEADLQNRLAEENQKLAQRRVEILRNNKNIEDQLRVYREQIWQDVLDYYWASSEASSGTRSPTQYSGGTLRNWLSSYPSMEFNLVYGDKYGVNWVNNGWKRAMKAFYGVAGNNFVNQYRFRELLNQQVKSLHFIESIPD